MSFSRLFALLIGIMATTTLNTQFTVQVEVNMTTIVNLFMTIVGGTVLLGRFGQPDSGHYGECCSLSNDMSLIYGSKHRSGGGSIPPRPIFIC